MGVLDDAMRHGAQEQGTHAPEPAAPHDDDARVLLVGHVEDRAERPVERARGHQRQGDETRLGGDLTSLVRRFGCELPLRLLVVRGDVAERIDPISGRLQMFTMMARFPGKSAAAYSIAYRASAEPS